MKKYAIAISAYVPVSAFNIAIFSAPTKAAAIKAANQYRRAWGIMDEKIRGVVPVDYIDGDGDGCAAEKIRAAEIINQEVTR